MEPEQDFFEINLGINYQINTRLGVYLKSGFIMTQQSSFIPIHAGIRFLNQVILLAEQQYIASSTINAEKVDQNSRARITLYFFWLFHRLICF